MNKELEELRNKKLEELRETIIKLYNYLQNGSYGNIQEIVNTYNTVFEGIKRKQSYTRCASCLRRYIKELYFALQEYDELKQEKEVIVEERVTENNEVENNIIDEEKQDDRSHKRGRKKANG